MVLRYSCANSAIDARTLQARPMLTPYVTYGNVSSLSPQELRNLVATMRALGVVQADGVILGPEPRTAPVADPPSSAGERAEWDRQQRREAALDALRWRVPGATDAELERLLSPEIRNAS
jgi:hypothetical protein